MKKIIALLLVCLMSLSSVAFATEFSDMPNDWSTEALKNAVANGLLGGTDGKILPSDRLTRAQMATIMVRACGATETADISEYTDVKPGDWYYDAMSKAVAMGAFNGSDGKLNPNNPITRQEAFVVLSRVFGISTHVEVDHSIFDEFSDGNQVAEWAKNDVGAIIAFGYVGGSGGKINPTAYITRAEFAVVMDRIIKYYIDDENATTIPEDGNVMIRVGGLKLDGLNTDKMIVVGDGVGEADMSIINSRLDSNLVIRAGKTIKLDTKGYYDHVKIIRPNIRVEGKLAREEENYETGVKYLYVGKDSVFAIVFGLEELEAAMQANEAAAEEVSEEAVEEEVEAEQE